MKELVSCIVPVFNGERFLPEAVDSLLAQRYTPLEIIVVDDGSTDGTRPLIESYGNRIRCVRQTNAGPATARNTGIAAAHGEFISFLDSDDLWHPDKLAFQMARFAARPDLGLCITHIQNFFMPELCEEEQMLRDHPRAQAMPGYTTVTLLAPRRLFDAIGVFNTALKHGDDTDWFLRAEQYGASIEVLTDVLVFRRLHANNRSRQWAGRSQQEYLRIMKTFVDAQRARQRKPGRDGQ